MFQIRVIAISAVLIAGCSVNDASYDDDDRDPIADREYDEPGRSRDEDWYRDERDDRPPRDRRPSARDVPRDAVVIDESTGESMRHEPAHPGRAYLYDVDDDYVAYETRLRPGERLAVDPERDSVKIDGVKDGKVNLRAKHRYRLYYLRDDKAPRDRRERY